MEEKRCVNREYKDRLFRLVFREKQDCSLYRSGRIPLPFPNCLVFYNGEEDAPEEEELLLSEAFRTEGDSPMPGVECRVRVLNINRGHNRELMEKCRRLWEYAEFIGMLRDNLKAGMGTAEAIDAP